MSMNDLAVALPLMFAPAVAAVFWNRLAAARRPAVVDVELVASRTLGVVMRTVLVFGAAVAVLWAFPGALGLNAEPEGSGVSMGLAFLLAIYAVTGSIALIVGLVRVIRSDVGAVSARRGPGLAYAVVGGLLTALAVVAVM